MTDLSFLDTSFLDTNVLLRVILDDHPDHSPRSRDLIGRVAAGLEQVVTSDSVVLETVNRLVGRRLALPRSVVADAVLTILMLDGVHLDSKPLYPPTLGRFLSFGRLSFPDCLHTTQADTATGGRIYTFDRGFDRLPGITRLEPS